jgi:hypothetical protein
MDRILKEESHYRVKKELNIQVLKTSETTYGAGISEIGICDFGATPEEASDNLLKKLTFLKAFLDDHFELEERKIQPLDETN